MSSDDAHDGGPLERSHMKGMVLKNALESAALIKTSKHLENQKKAFVRQNTRDEEEMKNLLYRLHLEQHGSARDEHEDTEYTIDVKDDIRTDTDELGDTESLSMFDTPVSNPYPVTIIPRYGGSPRKKDTLLVPRIGPRGTAGFRRKSIEYEDIQEALTSMSETSASSNFSERSSSVSTSCLARDTALGDWLARPDAISSVRRMRKTVTEQAHKKIYRKLSTESQYSLESLNENNMGPLGSRSRSNSVRERHDSEHETTPVSRKTINSRRGGSLKERKLSNIENGRNRSPKTSLGSMKGSLSDMNQVTETSTGSDSNLNATVRSNEGSANRQTNSKRRHKQVLCRKWSNEET